MDAFSCRHPAVNFLFFLGALGFGMVIQHPAYVVAGVVAALSYCLLLSGRAGRRLALSLLPFVVLVAGVNPLFNTAGQTVLFAPFGRPYTLEALCYGLTLAGMFYGMLLWFSCFNQVMTGDKFTSLFGNLMPSLSLLLVMVLRMVPGLFRKGRQITGARSAVGKAPTEAAAYSEKLQGGLLMLGCLTTWALEGSLTTADSMRSRGYGTAKRTGFMVYRMDSRDWWLLAILLVSMGTVIASMAAGATAAAFTPVWRVAKLHPVFFAVYCIFLLIPTLLHIKEAVTWHILRSKI